MQKEGWNGCVVYISPLAAMSARFSATPGGDNFRSSRGGSTTHTAPGLNAPRQQGPRPAPAFLIAVLQGVCPWLIDFRHNHNNSLLKPRHYAENSHLNATKYLFCCVRSFTRLLSPGIIPAETDIDHCRSRLLCVLIGVSDLIAKVLFHQENCS